MLIELGWPPSVNAMWRAFRGRTILSKVGRQWYAYAKEHLENAPHIKGPVLIHVELYPPSKRRFDPDNKIKPIFDALVRSGIIEDDNHHIIRFFGVSVEEEEGDFNGVKVEITPIKGF